MAGWFGCSKYAAVTTFLRVENQRQRILESIYRHVVNRLKLLRHPKGLARGRTLHYRMDQDPLLAIAVHGCHDQLAAQCPKVPAAEPEQAESWLESRPRLLTSAEYSAPTVRRSPTQLFSAICSQPAFCLCARPSKIDRVADTVQPSLGPEISGPIGRDPPISASLVHLPTRPLVRNTARL